jgi:hypothetical protein
VLVSINKKLSEYFPLTIVIYFTICVAPVAVFTIIFVSIAGLPIVMSLPLDPYLKELVVGFCFFIALVAANGFYFGPKSYLLLTGADLNAQFQLVQKKNSKVLSKDQMAETLRNENVQEDVDHIVREEFKREVPKNCTLQHARTRVQLWKELVAKLEMQATIESGSGNTRGVAAGLSGGSNSQHSHGHSVHESVSVAEIHNHRNSIESSHMVDVTLTKVSRLSISSKREEIMGTHPHSGRLTSSHQEELL